MKGVDEREKSSKESGRGSWAGVLEEGGQCGKAVLSREGRFSSERLAMKCASWLEEVRRHRRFGDGGAGEGERLSKDMRQELRETIFTKRTNGVSKNY